MKKANCSEYEFGNVTYSFASDSYPREHKRIIIEQISK